MYRVVINNYEEREKEIIAENQKLRTSIFRLCQELQKQIEALNSQQNGSKVDAKQDGNDDPIADLFGNVSLII